MLTGDLTHRRPVVHIRTRGRYLISSDCKVRQHNGAWKPGVIYADAMDLTKTYVRTEANFRENFEDPI